MFRRAASFALLLLLLSPLPGCPEADDSASTTPRVVVTIFPLYDLARRIAGPDLDVELLLPPGADVHTFSPTPAMVRKVEGSRGAIRVGLELDPWALTLIRNVATRPEVLELGELLDPVSLDELHGKEKEGKGTDDEEGHRGHEHGTVDPHVWLDARRMAKGVGRMAEFLARLRPDAKERLLARATKLEEKLRRLDEKIAEQVEAFPRKELVTYHFSFGTFAHRYGLRVVGSVEPYPGKELNPNELRALRKAITTYDVAAIYTQAQFAPQAASTLARELDLEILVLDPLGGVEKRETYTELLLWNVEQLRRGQS